MNGKSSGNFGGLSPAEASAVDRACIRFEATWRAGEWPCIEAYLDAVGTAVETRAVLLRRLIELEVELRIEAGEYPSSAEYRVRFPEESSAVADVFRKTRPSGALRPTQSFVAVDDPDTVTELAKTQEWDPLRGNELGAIDGGLGRIVGDYLILDRLGSGGMGVVYRALQRKAERLVALKLIKAEWWGDLTQASAPEAELRFVNEFQAHARFAHDHIVPVFDVGHDNGVLYFSMRLIKGRSLAQIVRSAAPLEPRRAAYYMEAIARAIQYIHDQGILHRDLKPGNVMVDEHDRPYVIDLGLAKAIEATVSLTVNGRPLGTPEYMAPEQARSDKVTVATDVYGLGATLYTLLTGRAPFRGLTPVAVLRQVIDEEVEWPRERDHAVGRELKAICLKCLAKDPKDRFSTAGDLARALDNYLENKPNPGLPFDRPWTPLVKWAKRKPWRAVATGTAIVALFLALVGGAATIRHDRAMAEVLVHDMASVPLSELPRKIQEMNGYRLWVNPRLEEILRTTPAESPLCTRALLALLPSDASRADELAERLLSAGPDEHRLIRESLRPHWSRVAPRIQDAYDHSQDNPTRRTRAGVALLAMGADERFSDLRSAPLPDGRVEFLDWIVRSKLDPQRLLARLETESDVSVRRMLIQALGALGNGARPEGLSAEVLTNWERRYRDDPDPGVHSSLAYAFRRWGEGARVKRIDDELRARPRGGRGWFVNSRGVTMVVLGGTHSGPADPDRPAYRFAIAATETTYGEFVAFDPNYPLGWRRPTGVLPQTDPDAGADVLSYHDAARFCNGLSAQEGHPPDQWCYTPGAEEGSMVLVPDFMKRKGYRLPLLREWVHAARAETITARYYGSSDWAPNDYAWHRGNSQRLGPSRVGQHRPNDFGLFDVIGNVMEWCHDPDIPHDPTCKCPAIRGTDCRIQRPETVRGGSFVHLAEVQSVPNTNPLYAGVPPEARWIDTGFRIVKKLDDE